MKQEILIKIIFQLLSNKTLRAEDLARKYEVSERTIYRYINDISLSGVPLVTKSGPNGGISIPSSYKINNNFLTIDEYNIVQNALSAFESNLTSGVISSAKQKFSSLRYEDKSGFTLKSGSVIIDCGPWGDTDGYKNKLKSIEKAIHLSSVLEISYIDRGGEQSLREIEPHTIVFKQGIWYIYAYCHLRKEFRFFKIGRMMYVNLTDKNFIRKEFNDKNLPFEAWYEEKDIVKITFKIGKNIICEIEEWLGVENIIKENGYFKAEVKLPNDKGLIPKIMSFGSELIILEPSNLKEELLLTAQKIIKNY